MHRPASRAKGYLSNLVSGSAAGHMPGHDLPFALHLALVPEQVTIDQQAVPDGRPSVSSSSAHDGFRSRVLARGYALSCSRPYGPEWGSSESGKKLVNLLDGFLHSL
jgi:hypothetical protein